VKIFIGLILFVIFLFLSLIHFFWGLGGKWGADGAIPSKANGNKVINPKSVDCFVVGIVLLCFGIFILIASEIISFLLPTWISNSGLWIISSLFILRAIGEFKYIGLFKRIRGTKFGRLDTKYFSPLCLLIGLLAIILSIHK